MTSFSILYCFHGQRFANEALGSCRSLYETNPTAQPLSISPVKFAPPDTLMPHQALEIQPPSLAGYRYKVEAMATAPLRQFIFLDTDTRIVGDLRPLRNRSQTAGIVGVTDPLLNTFKHIPSLRRPTIWGPDTDCLHELNSGVLGINRELLPLDFFPTWLRFHAELTEENPHISPAGIPDQPSLIQAIRHLGIIPLIVGAEYNFRPCYPQILHDTAKVIHIHDEAYTAHRKGAGVAGDVSVVFPWGLSVRRGSLLNRALYLASRTVRRRLA